MATIYRAVHYPRRDEWDNFNLDRDDRNILFHLSIRPALRSIVVNDMADGAWGAERHIPFVPPSEQPVILKTVLSRHEAQLLVAGRILITLPLATEAGPEVRVRSSMAWSASAALGPLRPGRAGSAWLPPDGVGAEELRGFLVAPGWGGGPAVLELGGQVFALRAEPVPGEVVGALGGEPPVQGFRVALDAAARQAIVIARADRRRALRIALRIDGCDEAEAWINPPGLVDEVADGTVSGWVATRGAQPRIELLAGGRPLPVRVPLGDAPVLPADARLAALDQEEGDGPAERRMRFRLVLPAAAWRAADADGLLDLRLLAEGAELLAGRFALPRPAAAARPGAVPAEPAAPAIPLAPSATGDVVEVLRLDIPPGAAEDVFIDLLAPDGGIPLHLRYRARENWLVANSFADGRWGRERVLARLPSQWERLPVDVEIGAGRCVIAVDHHPVAEVEAARLGLAALDIRGRHQRFARRVPRGPAPAPGAVPLGAVDRIEAERILGWVARPQHGQPVLLEAGGEPVDLAPVWSELPDLAARIGAPDPRIGFELPLPPTLRGRLGAEPLRLTHAGFPLSHQPACDAAVTEVAGFALRGVVPARADGTAPALEVLVDGRPMELAPAIWPEAAGDAAPRRFGFEVELPGTIWARVPDGADVPVDIAADGAVVEPSALVFTRAMARRALGRAARRGFEGAEAQAAGLLAVEHLAFGRFLPDLPAEAAAALRDFARRMKLEPFVLREGGPEEAAAPPRPAPVDRDSLDRIAVWRALRDLNRRIARDGEPVFDLARGVARDWALAGDRTAHFWFAIVPNLCATDELAKLRDVMPLSTWFRHEGANEAWALSSAVALLAAEGEVKRATDALYRLAASPQGWINTACIGFAARQVERMAAQRQLPDNEAERFRYAVLALLDAFKGEWFSRLHDRHLMEAMVLLLGRRKLVADYLAADLVKAAVRHYGLSPAFWAEWSRHAPADAEPEPLLELSQRHFALLSAATAEPARADAELARIHAALDFFRAHRNPEAVMWMRELAAHALRVGGTAQAADVFRLLAMLVAREPRDAVRIAAFPGRVPPGGLAALGLPPASITSLLREMRPQPRSATHGAQGEACRLLAAAAPADDARQDMLMQLADVLGDGRSNHLGADLRAMLAARRAGRLADAVVSRFEADLAALLAEEGHPHLPAPVLAGLARLERLNRRRDDPWLAASLRGLLGAVRARFGTLHDGALAAPPAPVVAGEDGALAGDVLVCVYSCNKYLDSRVAAIRATWMRDLAAVGARCIVVVGDGDDRLDGDVLRLDVSDAYEDLPRKTLRMVDWVFRHTTAQYLVKIDDDCQLSVPNYFGTLEYRAHHYHGRVLERAVGGMDRVWHHAKSTSERARGIDRSPEPSRYCDGGGAYSLSRFAMDRLVQAAASRAGQRLVACSFMEDKLVGDLLAMQGIAPDNTDYESYQRRRTFGNAHPVGIYENTFFPSRIGPAKVVHLDLAEDQPRALALRDRQELSPKKLWPGFATVGTDWAAHQLELLSAPGVLAAAQAERVGVVLAARNEMAMLPHFLDHYRRIGVRGFFVVDNASDDGSREYLLAQPDVVVYSATTEYRTSHYGVTWQQTVLGHHFLGRWAVVADADEFLIYPGWREKPIGSLVAAVEAEGAEAVPLAMVDMYPFGSLDEADFAERDPFEAAPWMDREPAPAYRLAGCYYSNRSQRVSALRHRLLPDSEPNGFVAEKVAMFHYRPWLRVSEGIHSAANLRVSQQRACFAHFKYHKGFRRKILDEIARGQHYNGAIEYRRYAAMVAESFGAFGREGLSVQLGPDGYPPG
ncbi:glycosyltransferase family 2 protein [Falsiroseomonas sp. CW058]|uniref:glycosyltransferase family 2 protein n=1 Tax=Falsiroseomonas sp. CW058 TaxID=3388664 RepID=UPI003D31E29F